MSQEVEVKAPVLDYENGNPGASLVLNRFREREMVHAYLITGTRGLGKRTFAQALACTLFCEAQRKPCFCCAECRKVLSGNNPDVITLYADDDKSIKIDPVRDIISTVSRHSFGSGYRIVLIEPVEKMTPAAQNCLLKSLQEPLSDVVFILMTHELSATLGTIASRCARVKMVPRQDAVLAETLVKCGYEEAAVQQVLKLCSGNIGHAIELLNKTQTDNAAAQFVQDALSAVTEAAAVGLSSRMKENKELSETCLRTLESAIHRAIMVRCGCFDESAIEDLPLLWKKAAQTASVQDMNNVLTAIFETRKRNASQVNWQSNVDHLLMILLEENKKWQK